MIYISPWLTGNEPAGNWALAINAGNARNAAYRNQDHNDQDSVTYKAYMLAGTYTCKVMALKNTTYGIMKIKIDGTTVVTWDTYKATLERNAIDTTTGIVVATSGIKTITLMVDGKNVSSTNHYLYPQEIVFYRTA